MDTCRILLSGYLVGVARKSMIRIDSFSSFPMFNKGSSSPCKPCTWVSFIVAILVLLSSVASLVGVYKAHFLVGGATFGTTNGSLALIALVANLAFLKKVMSCCPCMGSGKK